MKAITSFFLGTCLTSFASATGPQKELPNILVFIADDAGMDFGCFGNQGIRTPNIDKLAVEGMLFNNAFLSCSQCSPTRTSLLSGQFAHTIGTEDLHSPLPETVKILPSYLQEQGYYTGLMLKTHIGPHGMNQFNWYDNGGTDYRKGTWNDKAEDNFKQFLDASGNQPFFMWCAFIDPHRPYGDSLNGAPSVHRPEDVRVPPYLMDCENTRIDLAQYYDEIHRMDKHIGLMMKELKHRKLDDNTLVIFFSDNGYPFPRGKATLYDAGIQTPLIMKWKDHIKKGTQYNELVSMIDLSPTLLDIAGLNIPDEMYGQSITKIFKDQSSPGRQFIFAERNWHDSDAHMRCVRTKQYKLIINTYIHLPFPITGDYWRSGSWSDLLEGYENKTLNDDQMKIFEHPRPSIELYDVQNDPYELENLSANPEYKETVANLNAALLNWQIETNDKLPPQIPKRDFVDRKSGFLYDGARIRALEKN